MHRPNVLGRAIDVRRYKCVARLWRLGKSCAESQHSKSRAFF
jgi:hypothetical protein